MTLQDEWTASGEIGKVFEIKDVAALRAQLDLTELNFTIDPEPAVLCVGMDQAGRREFVFFEIRHGLLGARIDYRFTADLTHIAKDVVRFDTDLFDRIMQGERFPYPHRPKSRGMTAPKYYVAASIF